MSFSVGEDGLAGREESRVGGERKERRERQKGEGIESGGSVTFGGVAGLVLAPVAEDFVFYPWHIFGVGIIVLLLGPLGHGCGYYS